MCTPLTSASVRFRTVEDMVVERDVENGAHPRNIPQQEHTFKKHLLHHGTKVFTLWCYSNKDLVVSFVGTLATNKPKFSASRENVLIMKGE